MTTTDRDYDACVDYCERMDRIRDRWMREFNSKKTTSASWPVIPANKCAKLWLDFGRTGFVRDDKLLLEIADMMLDGIAMLKVSTELAGHESYCGRIAFTEVELDDDMTDYEWSKFVDFVVNGHEDSGHEWRISDYGLPKLVDLYSEIFRSESPEQSLVAIDKALNVIHQRGDLAKLFIEGGTATLRRIADQV